jgi:DNA-binding LacI/PurR family transcriptional regulator
MVEKRFLGTQFYELLQEHNIIQLNFDATSSHNSILLDYFSMGKLGVDFLYKQGVRKIGLIGDANLGDGLDSEDCAGFFRGVQSHPDMKASDPWTMRGIPYMSYGYGSFKKIWSAAEKPEGIVVSDEIAFLGVVMGMLELGVKYPRDLKLVVQRTKESKEMCIFSPPRLIFSIEDVASLAVNQIVRMVQEKINTFPTIRVSPELREESELQTDSQVRKGSEAVVC